MGMYTKFNVIIPIKKDAPQDVKTILRKIIEGEDITDSIILNHPFFNSNTKKYFAKSDSYYFTGTHNSQVRYNDYNMVLHIDCDFCNCHDEIDLFLDFVKPYIIEKNCFLGYSLYEEDTKPILYYYENGTIIKE